MAAKGKGLWITDERGGRRYRVLRMLGSGGEGRLFVCRTPVDDGSSATFEVVVKEVPGGAVGDLRAWLARNDKLRHVHHPGLVRVRDVFPARPPSHDGGQAPAERPDSGYVVMDLAAGRTLADLVADEPEAPVNERLAQLTGVASALDALHDGEAAGTPLVHGDVTPSNILVDEDGASILVDLEGMRAEDGPSLGALSLPYAAPELSRTGFRPTPEADRYAFAATVAHTLLGAPPPLTGTGPGDRSGESGAAAGDRVLDVPALVAALAERPAVARRPSLVAAVREALTAPPDRRPTSLTRWLLQLRAGGSASTVLTVARPDVAAAAERTAARARRHRRARTVGIAVGGALALAVAAAVVLTVPGLGGVLTAPGDDASAGALELPATTRLGPLEVEDQSPGDGSGWQYGLSWSGPEGARYLLLSASEDSGLEVQPVGTFTSMSFFTARDREYCFQVVGVGQGEGLVSEPRTSDGGECTLTGQIGAASRASTRP